MEESEEPSPAPAVRPGAQSVRLHADASAQPVEKTKGSEVGTLNRSSDMTAHSVVDRPSYSAT